MKKQRQGLNRYNEAVLMCTHNLCFSAEKKMYTPYKAQFYYIKVGVSGCSMHGHVCMMDIHPPMRRKHSQLPTKLSTLRIGRDCLAMCKISII